MRIFKHGPEGKAGDVRGDLETLRGQVKSLQASKDYLKKELIRLNAEVEKLYRRQELTLQFYEYRVDQIYRNIIGSMQEHHSHENRPSIRRLETDSSWEKLIFDARSPILGTGHIPSPLTLSGFRVDTRRAVERLHYIEILPSAHGIAVFGPYRKLVPGTYVVSFRFDAPCDGTKVLIEAFTAFSGNDQVVGTVDYSGESDCAVLHFSWPQTLADADIEFRVHQLGSTSIKLISIDIQEE
ncbi:MAG: hypothetical protein ACK4M0_05165 [Phreatobacter sp.]